MKSLQDPVTALKGVGQKRAEQLATLGIETIEDLLMHYPSRYDDFAPTNLETTVDKQKVTIHGTVVSEPVLSRFGYRKNRLSFRLQTGQQVVMVVFFNQPYFKERLKLNGDVTVLGTWNQARQQVMGSKLLVVNPGEETIGTIYPANKHVRQTTIRQLIELAYTQYRNVIATLIPLTIRQRYQLLDRATMFQWVHFPKTSDQARQARRTAAYEEFYLFQLRLQSMRLARRKADGTQLLYNNDELRAFIRTIPFELTKAQKRVVNEICRDLRSPFQMNRLLQGDVGSGKTIVAAIAIYATILTGYQAALMAPTEILAAQHAEKLAKVFENTPVNVALLTGSLTAKQHQALADQIAAGQCNLIIGTHALIQDQVEFANLGLAIIDEQHRFGVDQRKLLREKGDHPNILAMTATPIPRTLSITAYGEMDVSVIDELPAGRKTIKTTWLKSDQSEAALDFLRKQLAQGAQVYVVSPLIEESEKLDVQNATALYEQFADQFAPKYQVGLLHGRMTNDEKEAVMADFQAGKIQVLVATTVIEVGVDNPNATVMVIYDADRFGLAQLHQLRGRVGRGVRQSYCLLVADPKTPEGKKRMETMVETTDGFIVAQRDLELRGSGDVLGKKQSGMPDFKIGDPVGDLKMMQYARQDALDLLEQPSWDQRDENQPLVLYLRSQNLKTHFD
ncbi:ATP-dependent DNA helicase RecG [Lactobacillus sp. 3B(2020)]|uniref:ATP-dependent DNA helicase RecG n=1 Tax=Lactobacillus sp. 3B(2020) TaxID=2695882 RepID=UPI0015DFF679|nr:ATP-dependent DNA helicase RecG [Lactobacillus sp. 3B(2020)]QLL70192.1 ATP-dependent DNA helicase RecG [Lactobacillus sp. 3B(2020)]